MNIIPCMTLFGGQSVSAAGQDSNEFDIVSEDPIDQAGRWMDKGAQALFIYDLEGAREGRAVHEDLIKQIALRFPNFPIYLCGGIRDTIVVERYIKAGIKQLVLGTFAAESPDTVKKIAKIFEDKIAVSLSIKSAKLTTHAGTRDSEYSAQDLVKSYSGSAVNSLVVHDLDKSGSAAGVNLDDSLPIVNESALPVWVWGGVVDMDDIRALYAESDMGIEGVIVGRAFVDASLDLKEAEQYCEE